MEVQRHVGDKAHKKCKAAVILVPLSSFGCSIVPFMVWLWDLVGGHDSQQTQALEGVCLHVYTHTHTQNDIHICKCSCHIPPSNVSIHVVDCFSKT